MKTSSYQERLQEVVQLLFPNNKVTINARKAGHVHIITSQENKKYLELDVWLPELNLAFEYQDPHHYSTAWYGNASTAEVSHKDSIKNSQVSARGATLITVPYWWDGEIDSLVATIQSHRSDLLVDVHPDASPIPPHPPQQHFQPHEVPGVGELMLAQFPENFELFVDKSWWLTEKYDGVRACWNGTNLYTRYAKEITLHETTVAAFPKGFQLDGEIWFGRGNYHEKTTSVFAVSDAESPYAFGSSLYIAFDSPTRDAMKEYESRYRNLHSVVPNEHSVIVVSSCCYCNTLEQRKNLLETVTKENGEGIILRQVKSVYVYGRSETLLKHKIVRDLEALVLGVHNESRSCSLQLPHGSIIQAQTTLEEINSGDVVSFQFEDFDKSGTPYGATVTRVRYDMSWDDALRAPRQGVVHGMIEHTLKVPQVRKPAGYWNVDAGENTRKFFDDFAEAAGFDPLVAQNWYSITRKRLLDFRPHENGPIAQRSWSGSLLDLILEAYPEVVFQEQKFQHILPKKFWKKHQRYVLESYAKRMNFDPLVAKNWYSVNASDILTERGGMVVQKQHTTFFEMLCNVFPEVSFDVHQFRIKPRNYWNDKSNRKGFFDMVAKRENFDPLVAANWYSYERQEFLGKQVARIYNDSIIAALTDVYPTLSLDPSKFAIVPQHFYASHENQRAFFEEFAQKNSFDPLKEYNWYTVNYLQILQEKGGPAVLGKHKSFSQALQHAFPELTIDSQNFVVVPAKHWKNKENVRRLLSQLATHLGFDPLVPDNWYPVRYENVMHFPKFVSAMRGYNGRLFSALLDVFPDIGLDKSRFSYSGYWSEPENRRLFFERYAEKNGFDPTDKEKWYNLSFSHFSREKKAGGLITYCSERKMLLHEALCEAMPELNLDLPRFLRSKKTKKYKEEIITHSKKAKKIYSRQR